MRNLYSIGFVLFLAFNGVTAAKPPETHMALTITTTPAEGETCLLPGEPMEGVVAITLPKTYPPPRYIYLKADGVEEPIRLPYEELGKTSEAAGATVQHRYAVPLFFKRGKGDEARAIGWVFPEGGEHVIRIATGRGWPGEVTPALRVRVANLGSETEKRAFVDYGRLFEVPRLLWFGEAPLVREDQINAFLDNHADSAYAPAVRLALAFHRLSEIEQRHPDTKAGVMQQHKDKAKLAPYFESILRTPCNSFVQRRAMYYTARMFLCGEDYAAARRVLKDFVTTFEHGLYVKNAKATLRDIAESQSN